MPTGFHRQTLVPLTALLTLGTTVLGSVATAQTTTIVNNVLQGTIADWPQGTPGTVRLTDKNDENNFAEGTVDPSGHFTLTLPPPTHLPDTAASLDALFSPVSRGALVGPEVSCTAAGMVTPRTGKWDYFSLTASAAGQTLAVLKLNSNPRQSSSAGLRVGVQYGALTYLDTATTLDATVSCPPEFIETFKGTFRAGWHLSSSRILERSPAQVEVRLTTPDPLAADLQWRLYDEVVGVGLGLDPEYAPQSRQGIQVTQVREDGAAAQAGVQVGDVIMTVDGKDVTGLTFAELVPLIRGDEPGTTVTLGVKRGTQTTLQLLTITRVILRVP